MFQGDKRLRNILALSEVETMLKNTKNIVYLKVLTHNYIMERKKTLTTSPCFQSRQWNILNNHNNIYLCRTQNFMYNVIYPVSFVLFHTICIFLRILFVNSRRTQNYVIFKPETRRYQELHNLPQNSHKTTFLVKNEATDTTSFNMRTHFYITQYIVT